MKTEEYNSTKELTPENNSSQNQKNKKSKIMKKKSKGWKKSSNPQKRELMTSENSRIVLIQKK